MKNPRLREKFLRVIDGYPDLVTLAFYMNEHVQCERILDWCIVNKVTGFQLITFFKFNGSSILATIKEIVRRLEKEGNVRPLIIGKDMRR